ncbi:MAG: RagB/SusD family nutrient uptake outer membrane protein [Mangrovibacterium sp.]
MKYIKQTYKRIVILAVILMGGMTSCNFLDVVPDNVATIDNAFNLRYQAEKYLFTCYSYLPKGGDPWRNVAHFGGDEAWAPYNTGFHSWSVEIARGYQRTTNTYQNAWDGNYDGGGLNDLYPLYDGIRHCNIFLDNVSDRGKVLDLEESERVRWLAEVEFLKAYYHFMLFRRYGPIAIMDTAIPIDADENEVSVSRDPVDDVVNFIVDLLDKAIPDLPDRITDEATELGRITKPIGLAVKAEVLMYWASPLFNGNTDYSSFVDKNGVNFFNQTYDAERWKKAADAAKEAIDIAESYGAALYHFTDHSYQLSDTTFTILSINQAVCERWNSEIIWGNPNSNTQDLQRLAMPHTSVEYGQDDGRSTIAAPLKVAKMYYTRNGVPIDKDKTLDFNNYADLETAGDDHQYYIESGYTTARLNFDREPRFYAHLAFDGSIYYKKDSPSNSDKNTWVIKAKYLDYSGANNSFYNNITGYFAKKCVDWNQSLSTSGVTYKNYPWPEIRLAELYLMYAECLNEYSGPVGDVFTYVDEVRERAGIPGVKDAWTKYSTNPVKFTTKEGMRDIIQQERMIELAFEGKRFWDLRRWKLATQYLNQPIQGWNVYGKTAEAYYQPVTIYMQQFISPRDYLWPMEDNALLKNTSLVQNPGW